MNWCSLVVERIFLPPCFGLNFGFVHFAHLRGQSCFLICGLCFFWLRISPIPPTLRFGAARQGLGNYCWGRFPGPALRFRLRQGFGETSRPRLRDFGPLVLWDQAWARFICGRRRICGEKFALIRAIRVVRFVVERMLLPQCFCLMKSRFCVFAANRDHFPLPASRQTTTPSLRKPISTCRTTVGDGFGEIRSASSACPATKYPSQLVVTLDAAELPPVGCPRTVIIMIDPTARTRTTMIDPTILAIFVFIFRCGCRCPSH